MGGQSKSCVFVVIDLSDVGAAFGIGSFGSSVNISPHSSLLDLTNVVPSQLMLDILDIVRERENMKRKQTEDDRLLEEWIA